MKSSKKRELKSGEQFMFGNYENFDAQPNLDETTSYKNRERLSELQKKTGVARLAGGIAHHYNNLLSVVIGYSTLLQMKMEPDDPLREYVEHILSSAEIAADLTKKLLILSCRQKMDPKITDLNDTVRSVQRRLSLFIKNDISLEIKLIDRDLPVMIDAIHFEEVLLDLVSNAMDAMPLGGTLTVVTEYRKYGRDHARNGNGNIEEHALLTVTDTGIGMTRKVKERVFDPFFTTKGVGKGAGLGLSTVYGIIMRHNGTINIESQLGQGTKVDIHLPLIKPCRVQDNIFAEKEVPMGLG
ncbi:MAG TPA: ATP-binding protein [Syntrophorhabdaceae bacterium]|nr:ATP-binding protein [Syntrophorhabdaceae bacterium]